jgi:hypothetical protein
LIGTLSGCGRSDASWCSIPQRARRDSPMPMMPPLQTVMPALRTRAIVSSRSVYVRVVMMLP